MTVTTVQRLKVVGDDENACKSKALAFMYPQVKGRLNPDENISAIFASSFRRLS